MGYIYKITNDINDKIYIGKTEKSIQTRWSEHCRDSIRFRLEKRPLYEAMNKYGIEHFHIEEIEETNNTEEREKYWISFYDSYKNGYNATRGGDGKHYADYELIYNLFKEGYSSKQIHLKTGYDLQTIASALENYGISKTERIKRGQISKQQPVAQIDIETNEIIKIYPTLKDAENATGNSRHICDVCNGRYKTCKGYKWKYLSDIK